MLASIGVLDRRERLLDRLDDVLVRFRKTAHVDISARRDGPQEFLEVQTDVAPARRTELRLAVARAVAEHIHVDLEPILLEGICERVFRPSVADDKMEILTLAGRTLAREGGRRWGRRIAKAVAEYLKESARLNLRGFITFRLKDYVDDLEDAVDQAVDDFLVEREYAEFVRLLRYFVEAQTPRMDRVHVTVGEDGAFRLFDGSMAPLDGGDLKEFIFDTMDTEVAYEDFLVSALISLAPGSIVIHDRCGQGDPSSIDTVKNVFVERVNLCRGCRLCAPGKEALKR